MLAARSGRPGDDLTARIQAAVINSALRAAVEHYAFHTDPETSTTDGLFQTLRIAMRTGLPGPDSEPAGQ